MIEQEPLMLDLSPTRLPFKDQFRIAGFNMDRPGDIDLADTKLMLFSTLNALEAVLRGTEK
jgi:hypothetical protein